MGKSHLHECSREFTDSRKDKKNLTLEIPLFEKENGPARCKICLKSNELQALKKVVEEAILLVIVQVSLEGNENALTNENFGMSLAKFKNIDKSSGLARGLSVQLASEESPELKPSKPN